MTKLTGENPSVMKFGDEDKELDPLQQGDLIWVSFDDPPIGHEQAGRRPAIIISSEAYNSSPSGLIWVCPITGHSKKYPYEVPISCTTPSGKVISGVILSDQPRAIDPSSKERRVQVIGCVAPVDVIEKVITKILTVIPLPSTWYKNIE